MKRTVTAVFDGETLRPEEPLDLVPHRRYCVTIEETAPEGETVREPGALDSILDLAQDFGIPDLAEQHDHYLYGTPKR